MFTIQSDKDIVDVALDELVHDKKPNLRTKFQTLM